MTVGSSVKHITLTLILLTALLLRLGYALTQDTLTPFERTAGGDEWWYLEFGYRQITDIYMEAPSTAPLYLIVLGGLRYFLQPENTELVMLVAPPGGGLDIPSVPGVPAPSVVIVVRVLQALMSTATVFFVYRITRTLSDDDRAGLLAAAVMAVSVAMLVSAAEIQTETLYLFFLTAAMMLYVELAAGNYTHPLLWLAVCGGLFGLATLTRAVLLLFPLGLLIHALLMRWRGIPTQATVRGVTVLLAVYIAVCAVWTGFYAVRWGEFVVGAKGMTAFFYLGTQGSDVPPPEEIDNALGASRIVQDYAGGAQAVIAQNPAGYVLGRVQNLAAAYAQPYGTNAFRGESLKALALNWLQEDRSLSGGFALVRGDAFLPKLLIYLVHYGGMALGLAGMWLCRGRWPLALPLLGFIAYVTLLHLALLALPRYLFPLLPFWWCFAAVALVCLWDGVRQPRRESPHAAQPLPVE